MPSGWNDTVPRFSVQLACIREAVLKMITYVLGKLMALLVCRKDQPDPCFGIEEGVQVHPAVLIKTPLSTQLAAEMPWAENQVPQAAFLSDSTP